MKKMDLKKLADEHGVKTYKRHFIDRVDGTTTFIDIELSPRDLRDALIAAGVLQPPSE